jgi:hypothetical protein
MYQNSTELRLPAEASILVPSENISPALLRAVSVARETTCVFDKLPFLQFISSMF